MKEIKEVGQARAAEKMEELIVISDLHLSAGRDPETGQYSRNEDFFFDEEFKRFLLHLQKHQNKYNRKNHNPPDKGYFHLIIAGDMFDFLQVTPDFKNLREYPEGVTESDITEKVRKFGFGTKENETIWKLKIIARGHEGFFKALAGFLSKGNCLSIITGNHDIELYWPEVQKELIKQIKNKRPSKAQEIENNISFCHWFYYSKKFKTYIEHGNQYDSFNSFEYFLYPVLGKDPDRLWLPIGSFFVRYFFNRLEIRNPFADNIKPSTKYMRWAWKDDKLQFLKCILYYLPLMIKVWIMKCYISGAERRDLEKKNAEQLEALAKIQGVEPEHAKKIYNLRITPLTYHKVLNILTSSNLFFLVSAAIVFAVLFLLARYSVYSYWNTLYSIVLLILPFAKFIWKYLPIRSFKKKFIEILVKVIEWTAKTLKDPISKWLLEFFQRDLFVKACVIQKYLTDAEKDVRTIVFGHTHDPEIRPNLRDENISDNKFRYFNVGTWTTVFSEEERIIREAKQFAFVQIKENGTFPAMLYQWKDYLNQPEKLILFEPAESGN